MIRRSFGFAFVATIALTACSSSDSAAPAGAAGSGGTGGTGGVEPIGSLVILGDSISDRGTEADQTPVAELWYSLVEQNDDTKFADWKGKDLKTLYPNIKIVHAAKGGSVGTDLVSQAKGLPASLPGPVYVTVTIGGNDVKAAFINILQAKDQADRDAFKKELDDTFDELTKAGRFGTDVKVRIIDANIYDPSDGTGNFAQAHCPAPLSLFPPDTATDPLIKPWNDIVSAEVAKYGVRPTVIDIHALFKGHGVNAGADDWFVGDCNHPNPAGDSALRDAFWGAITSAP